MDEADFPLGSVFSENTWVYYDDQVWHTLKCASTPSQCEAEPPLKKGESREGRCHLTEFPKLSCVDALEKFVGAVTTTLRWERIPYNVQTANLFRVGKQTSVGADLLGVDNLAEDVSIVYKYIPHDSCTLKEGGSGLLKGCVAAPGWRRLLRFTSSSKVTSPRHYGVLMIEEYWQDGHGPRKCSSAGMERCPSVYVSVGFRNMS